MTAWPGIPRGKDAALDRAEHCRDKLTRASPCPFCRRRCLAHLSDHWRCLACEQKWTGHKAPDVPDPLAGVRAAVARARNLYAPGERARLLGKEALS